MAEPKVSTLCVRCGRGDRWYPVPVAKLDAFLSRRIKRTPVVPNGYAIRKSVCYGLQYLEYLSKTLVERSLSEVLLSQSYKTFLVTGIGIVEGLLFYPSSPRA
jgi:hypothetical protein